MQPYITPDIAVEDPSPLSGWDDHITGHLMALWATVQSVLLAFQDLLPPTAGPRQPQSVLVDKRLMITSPIDHSLQRPPHPAPPGGQAQTGTDEQSTP